MKKALIALAAAFIAVFTFAEGESLAETGGFVPVDSPALAFKGITLSDLGTTYFPSVTVSGRYAGPKGATPLFCRAEETSDGALSAITYQAQWYDGGYIKAAIIKFTEKSDGVYAQLVGAKAKASGVQAAYGTDFTGDTNAYTTTSDTGDGYAICGLRLSSVDDVESINLNFYHSTYKLYGTADIAPAPYTVNVKGWSQLVGNNGSLYGLTLVGKDNGSEFYPAFAATATISGTRGSYSYSSYNSTSSLLYGYIDENENNTTPTVTISNVPFEFYKVVFYASTDNDDIRFGYVSVNGVNYNSGNSEKDDTQPYETTTGTAEWGKSRVTDYIEGVNYLVTPVLAATSDGSVKVVGHKQTNGRGCIAAVQIIKATIPEIASTDVTAAQINATVPSGESFLRVSAGATITLDEALTASKVKFVSDGTITLSANEQPSAEELAKLDFACVKGSVLRSWLTPGVIGFNFNADGGRENNGTEDSCSDTSLALEIGTWYKNGHNQSGSSTEMFADGLSTLTWASKNVYAEAGDIADGTFIQGYLDDGQNVSITLSAVPYETYDLIIYCSTDNLDKGFKAKTVNGTIYTWDSATGAVTTTTDANAVWGLASLAAGKAVYGANTLRINGLSGALSILGGTNSNNGRGCISAIQIMPAGTSTAPEMTVGTAGQTTQATWTGANWNVATAPTSGNVIINLSGDVELTVDETVALSAITVNGEGSLTIIPDQPHNVTLTASSISSAIPVLFANDGIGIDTISASITYLYKTPSIKSSTHGNTYTAGVGSQESSVAINHNGGSVVLDGTAGEIYWLSQSNSDTSTAVTFTNATVNYSNGLSVGMANYTVGGASVITTTPNSDNNHSFYLSDGQASRTASFILKDTSVVNVSGASDVDSNQASILFGHWNGTSTFTIQDEAAFNAVAQVLVGKTSNNHTININGGTFTARGIKASASASGANTLNLNGGLLVLGDVGITSYGSTTIGVNVSANSEIRASAATLPISQAMTLGANTTLAFTKANDVSAATVSLTGAVSGSGDISVGPGVTLSLGTNRPEGQITVDEDGVLAIVMIDKSEVPVLHVTAQPATVKIYAPDGVTEYADATVEYDSEAGTITVKTPRPIWNATTDSAFDTVGNWSSGNLPGNGQDVTVNFASDTDMTVSGSYTLGDLAFTGAGNATVSGSGSIAASAYDFSGTTGRVEYNLPTGDKPVSSGSNTLLLVGGSGAFSVADGKMLTLGPWGTAAADGITYEFLNGGSYLTPAAGSTLVFSPGEGKVQKTASYDQYHSRTTIVVTNGTYVADRDGGGDGFFGSNSIRIDNGGVLSLENAKDLTGYNNTASTITINEGGTLQVKMRDTLRRPVVLNGGTITVQGEQGDDGGPRALDMHDANTVTVTKNSLIQAIDDGTVSNPLIYLRGIGTTFNIDDGISLVNNVTYQSFQTGTLTIRGTMNNGNGNGSMVMNGFNGNPITFTGLATIGGSGKPVMYVLNCEHENGTYVVNAGSRLMGSGSITGNGGVTLAAANSKICGSLTVNNVTAASGGTYGDQWNSVAAKIVGSFFATNGIQTVQNGSLTIGKDCVVTNAAGTANTTAASFSIATNGNLRIEKDLTVAGLTVADGGKITLVGTKDGVWDVPELTVAGEEQPSYSYSGKVNVVLDFGKANVPSGFKVKLPTGVTEDNVTVTDSARQRKWRISSEGGGLCATSDGGFRLIIR